MPMKWWHSDEVSTAGTRFFASFWLDTITARAPEFSSTCV